MNNNNNRQSVNNFVYQKKNKTQNNNTQSVNNFVYRKKRSNDTPQVQPQTPPQQNSAYNFTERNTQPQNNNYTSSNNYNSYVSENNYNSYTSSYQPTNSYNNNFNANQNDYSNNSFYNGNNNYNNNPQTYQQNIYPNNNIGTYQDYNTPVNYQNDNSQPIEVPIPHGFNLYSLVIVISLLAPFVLTMIAGVLASMFPFLKNIVSFLFPFAFAVPFVGIIAASIMEMKRLKRACTVPVTGHFAGYAKQRRKHKNHHYTVYAPKYEIFINNRREIRTINNFTKGQHAAATANLLANPSGYEIIYAEKNFAQSRAAEIIGTVILVIIIACFILPLFFGF